MTIFRSQTDERLAARWDAEPWISINHGHRGATALVWDDSQFLPRVDRIPSRDPLPYFDTETDDLRLPYAVNDPSDSVVFDPRPEFVRPPVNRVLAEFRNPRVGRSARRFLIAIVNFPDSTWTPAEIDHARKVLTRLAAWPDNDSDNEGSVK